MKLFKITSHIPIPSIAHQRGGRKPRFPFHKMAIGDSFYANGGITRGNLAGSATAYGKRYNKRFVTRKERTGCRVWRVQ